MDKHDPFIATISGDSQFVESMIKKGYDINKHDSRTGTTALHIAVQLNDTEMVKILLENGADVSAECSHGCTPLYYLNHYSDYDQALEIVKMIVGQNVSLKMDSYISVWRFGSEEMVQALLYSSIDLYGKDTFDRTPIHHLAENKNDGIINVLHGKKFEANATDYILQRTALHYAAESGHLSAVEFLLNNGADPNIRDRDSKTPLYVALFAAQHSPGNRQYRHVIELLLECGANPQLTPHEVFEYMFERSLDLLHFSLLEPIIGHLALIEKQLKIKIAHSIVKVIKSHAITKHFFEICRKQLNTLEAIKINDSLTLYQLLISSNSTIEHYARDPDIVLKIKSICVNEQSYRPFGLKIRKRFIKALKMANLRKEAAFAFCDLTGLNYNSCCLFVDKMVDYLSRIDLKRLCEV